MTALGTNIPVYAHHRDAPFHAAAKACLTRLAAAEPWAIPWPCIHEFRAVVTRRKAFSAPSPLAVAIRQVDLWLT